MAGGATIWPRTLAAAQRALEQTEHTPLRRLVRALYLAVARATAAYLPWGETRPAAYVRAGLGTGEFVPGRSDIDLAIVVAADRAGPGPASARVWRRWERLERALPETGRLLDVPRIYDELELSDVISSSALTYGLDGGGADRPALIDEAASIRRRILQRPGLYGATADWRLLSGPDRRPTEPARSAQERRIAGWLELVYWWRWAFMVCAGPGEAAAPGMFVKLVAEPVRIWLWLARGERFATRAEVLRQALQRLPEEEDAIRAALAFERSPRGRALPSLGVLLAALLRLSARIALLISDEIADAGATEVRLVGHGVDAGGPVLPLCDWRTLAAPAFPDESFVLHDGNPAEPADVGAAVRGQRGPRYGALLGYGLLILPATSFDRSRMRAIKAEVTDPVSFALVDGSSVARFPNVRGFSAQDTARRAVAEHRAWLERSCAPIPLWKLLSAARAALFLESIWSGDPELAPTLAGAAQQFASRSPDGAVEEAVRSEAVEALRALVLRLPGYRR